MAGNTPKQKVEDLLLTIGNYIDEIAGIQRLMWLRPESSPPTCPDAARESLVRLQTKLANILAKNKTHLMDPIHDEVLFQIRQIEQTPLDRLRKYACWLARTEQEELDKQRWRTRAVLQESTVDLPMTAAAARQLQQSLLLPPPSSESSSRGQSHRRSRSDPYLRPDSRTRSHSNSRSRSPSSRDNSSSRGSSGGSSNHEQRRQRTPDPESQKVLLPLPAPASALGRAATRIPTSSAKPAAKPTAKPAPATAQPSWRPEELPTSPDSAVIMIGWVRRPSDGMFLRDGELPEGAEDDEPALPSGRILASSIYDPAEISMPAMPPANRGFDPARPLRYPSWGPRGGEHAEVYKEALRA